MIQLDNISLAFGQQTIFDSVSCSINTNQKIGLVGKNGSGKTTALNLIAKKQALDSGRIRIPKTLHCAFMPQDVVLTSQKTILNEALSAFPLVSKYLDELAQLEQCIENNKAGEKEHEQYATIHQNLYEIDYETKRSQAKQILTGLGFSEEQLEQPVSSLSVGWKMRLVLATLLLQKADFYLFDEPTNHLDLSAKEWFVEFLRSAPFGFILVSHDEYFLNTVCNTIYEISNGNITIYQGNYQSYLKQKKENTLILEKKYEEQQKFIKKQQATIDRFRSKANKARMAQSMIKSLRKIELITIDHEEKNVNFTLPPAQRSGKVVLDVQDLGFSFGSKKIFDHATFHILRGNRVAIVASNGMGKTTLLNIITGIYRQDHGTISLGHNVRPAFFEQDQNKSLNPNNTIIEEVESTCETSEAQSQIRSLLGSFLFSGDDIYKKIEVLSGGEKNRVAMVKILLKNANFLILDEPTNHLDITSKNILCNMLSNFKGTILFVSHDRTFLNNLATHILELTPDAVFSYSGNYDTYLYYKKNLSATEQQNKSSKATRKSKRTTHDKNAAVKIQGVQKQIQKIENTIKQLEKEEVEITKQFALFAYGTPEYEAATIALHKNKEKYREQYARWEQLMTKLD